MSKNGWTSKSTIIAFVITVVGGVLTTWLCKIDVLKTIGFITDFVGDCISWFWHGIISVLTFNIKAWWILVLASLIWIIFKIVSATKIIDSLNPPYFNYTTGKFKKWNWSWIWKFDSNRNAWIITNLKAHCPKCNTPLIDYTSWHRISFECPRCDYKASDSDCEEPHKVESVILDNIDRDKYTK